MRKLRVFFNEEELTQYLSVVENLSIPWIGDKITIPIRVSGNIFSKIEQIKRILYVDDFKKLRFGNDMEYYYLAKPEFNIENTTKNDVATGTLNFNLKTNISYSDTVKTFESTATTIPTRHRIKIYNNGSAPAPVDYEIQIGKESGYLAIVSQYGAIQYGNTKESDGSLAEKSILLNDDLKKWINVIGTSPSSDILGDTSQESLKRLELPNGVKNFSIWAECYIKAERYDDVGSWTLTLTDNSDYPIASINISKDSRWSNAEMKIIVDNKEMRRKSFSIDKYSSIGKAVQIQKEGDKFTFFFDNEPYVFTVNGMSERTSKYVTFHVKGTIKHTLSNFKMMQMNVKYYRDTPNRFPQNSTFKIFGEKGKMYVDERLSVNDEVLGTEYFLVPPGETDVDIIVSDFSSIIKAKAKIRERRL